VRTGCTRLAICAASPNWRENGLVFHTIGTTVPALNVVNRHFKPLLSAQGFEIFAGTTFGTRAPSCF
jgi:hypothetical protein